jgi:uncharacterized repeat protein (TIGR03806 family)
MSKRRSVHLGKSLLVFVALVAMYSCGQKEHKRTAPVARKANITLKGKTIETNALKQLSDYGFFKGQLAELNPSEHVYPYAINTPLFSDYAQKARFIYLPNGKQMDFNPNGPLDFEDGAILIKNFYYPKDERNPVAGRRIIETRLLMKEKGGWNPLNYLWNEAQTEANLDYVGKSVAVNWINPDGVIKKIDYVVPNQNQCKNCHNANNKIVPIALTAAQLNQRYRSLQQDINQLDYFKQVGILKGLSTAELHDKMPAWNDVLTASVEERAKAYLDANCAHCHSAQGSAKNSGLYLNYHENDQRKRGVFKPPIAAGKGSGDHQYDIVPGKPEESIFMYRMKSNDPAIRMPEIGRSVVHEEGIDLLQQYIKGLVQD